MKTWSFRLIYRIVLIIFSLFYGISAYPGGWSRFALLVAVIAIFMTIEDLFMKEAEKKQRTIFVVLFALVFFVTFFFIFLA
ncbi:hypothetical protein L2D08_00540 [Domibacillus sp. PGB-M46]|uniref:hypothetical protein n=1 Tax=Domibacillus sp. PGB-M46 TaxID=2910255 RepID=UPI001F59786F|nr:hypothetical protein [Domibacillus sp. PGB-M46]MCI2252847.1 hypothetical protein [Domibacillus sp. PGB-M46]